MARCRAQWRRLAQAEHLTWRRPVTTHLSDPWRTLCKNAAMISLPCRHIISRWPNSGRCTGLLCPSGFLSWLRIWITSKPIWIKMHIDCHAVCSFFTAMLGIHFIALDKHVCEHTGHLLLAFNGDVQFILWPCSGFLPDSLLPTSNACFASLMSDPSSCYLV